ncbi:MULTISPECIES: hypothetical protein [Bradyrhizobium]|uniref:hypothetical protein n=1 Tax=Bradyrhizobium TaxID=374 RepID=UPI000841A511|nr:MULTISPECIES: hypothetical protein [Bradyrhizobium]MCA6103602.1 hypothetical protein [Bradyrhizobium australafricanum]ODM75014.1 hypothetical protein A6452_38835 [Bradyrhizobium elkanii]ODM82800.1 hypothetical protein A6X20_16925 [Bradyrhizobium elkanii]
MKVPSYASEFATVEKTVEFAAAWGGSTSFFRIEALREEGGSCFCRVYIKRRFEMSDALTIENGVQVQAKGEHDVWVDFPAAPWSHGKTADEALNHQMSLLSDRLKKI